MVALLGKLKGNAASGNGSNPPVPPKKDPVPLPMTPLKRMLQDAGPLRNDGSDKFFGMENAQFGNTCYCNSILQCLYYSVPFRESVVNYPRRSPPQALSESLTHNLRYPDPNITLEEILKPKPTPITPGKPNPPPPQPQKPEDKESSDSKKKIALNTLPLLETRDNSASYGMKESLFTSLKDIFEAIGASPERMGVIRPYHFLEVLRRQHEMFRSTMHQDAHEFLNLLLNEVVSNVEADANRITDVDEQSDQGSEGVSELTPTSSSGSTVPSNGVKSLPNTRWVHELFEGTLTSETQCLTCETVSQRDEVFLDLSVDLEQHTSVTACLRKFSEEEVLCERNKFYCDNCGGLQEAEKRMKIKRLPKILALHLKRFKYSEDSDRLQKLFHRVVYPYYLRLFNTTDDAEDPDRLYELYAVVVHIGGGPHHGHYVAIIKTEDRGWLLFDDEIVEPVDRDYVRTFFGDRAGLASAYVLFYQETTFEAMQRELAKENQMIPRNTIEFKDTVPPAPKMNGHPVSPDKVHRVQSATEEIPVLESVAASPVKPVPSAPPQLGVGTEEPNLLPHPKSPLSAFIPKIGDLHLRKERTKEEKEKRAAEKEKEKLDKKQKALEAKMNQARMREDAALAKAIESSKASKAEEDRRNATAGKGERESGVSKVGGLSRFKLGARSVSQSKLFHWEKERTEPVPDVPSLPLMNNSQPESTTDVSARAHPSNASTDDDKDDSTNSTSVCGLERPPLSTRTTALPPIPNEDRSDEQSKPKQAVPKRSRFSLRKKSFSVF